MMEAKVFRTSDAADVSFEEIKVWFDARGWAQVTQEILPEIGIWVPGFAALFLYQTDSPLGWMEWAVTNPVADAIKRREALDLCIDECIRKAKEVGIKVLLSSLNHERLIERYKSKGFAATDVGMTNMARTI